MQTDDHGVGVPVMGSGDPSVVRARRSIDNTCNAFIDEHENTHGNFLKFVTNVQIQSKIDVRNRILIEFGRF